MALENLYCLVAGSMVLGILVYCSAVYLSQTRVNRNTDHPEARPFVSIIMPLTGDSPLLSPGLESILAQDYPCYELILVVESQADPAWPLVKDVAAKDQRVVPVTAGPAEHCGQKNKNLLAGLERIKPDSGIVVFTDAEHLAEQDFLIDLAAPIIKGEAAITSGYHHYLPQEGNLAGSAKAVCVQLLNLTRTLPLLHRPWGGATAVDRKALDKLDLVSLWSTTVVDDVTLARRKVGRSRLPLKLVAPKLATPDQDVDLATWNRWLTRQVAFIKPSIVNDWLSLGFIALWLNLAFFSSLAVLGSWLVQGKGNWPVVTSLLFFMAFFLICTFVRRLHPKPGPLAQWWGGCVASMVMGLWCFVTTCFTNQISWRGKIYQVGWQGRVKGIAVRRSRGTGGKAIKWPRPFAS